MPSYPGISAKLSKTLDDELSTNASKEERSVPGIVVLLVKAKI
jgi:hypothetical protein